MNSWTLYYLNKIYKRGEGRRKGYLCVKVLNPIALCSALLCWCIPLGAKGLLLKFPLSPLSTFKQVLWILSWFSSPPCRKVVRLTLGFFLLHCHSKLWSFLQSFQERDHQFSNDNAIYRCQNKLLGTKRDESATLSKWLHCPMYYRTICYQSIWKTYRPICKYSQGTHTSLQITPLQWILVVPNLLSHELVGVKDWSSSALLWTPPCFVL